MPFAELLRRHALSLRLLGIALVGGGTAVALTDFQWHAVGRALQGAQIPVLIFAGALNLSLHMFLKAWRFRLLLRRRPPIGVLYRQLVIGNAISNVLPARAGEVARLVLMRRAGLANAECVSALLTEKAHEVLGLALVALPLLWMTALPVPVQRGVTFVLTVAGGTLVFVAALRRCRPRWLAEGTLAAGPLALTALARLTDVAVLLFALAATGLSPVAAHGLLVLLFIDVAIALPALPAGLGALEAAAVGGLALVGVEREPALAFALAYHALQWLPVTLLGLCLCFLGPRDLVPQV